MSALGLRELRYKYAWHCPCGETDVIRDGQWLKPPATWHRCSASEPKERA
jgi:hypothetical protein